MARNKKYDMTPKERLELFHARVEELQRFRLLQKEFDISFKMEFSNLKGRGYMAAESSEPDDEELRSFLTLFRQFMSDNEPIHLEGIYNILFQYITNDELKERLKEARQAWKESLRGYGTLIFEDGSGNRREMTPELATDIWINGFYFHSDIKKYNFLKLCCLMKVCL
jgi:hypothetical protein